MEPEVLQPLIRYLSLDNIIALFFVNISSRYFINSAHIMDYLYEKFAPKREVKYIKKNLICLISAYDSHYSTCRYFALENYIFQLACRMYNENLTITNIAIIGNIDKRLIKFSVNNNQIGIKAEGKITGRIYKIPKKESLASDVDKKNVYLSVEPMSRNKKTATRISINANNLICLARNSYKKGNVYRHANTTGLLTDDILIYIYAKLIISEDTDTIKLFFTNRGDYILDAVFDYINPKFQPQSLKFVLDNVISINHLIKYQTQKIRKHIIDCGMPDNILIDIIVEYMAKNCIDNDICDKIFNYIVALYEEMDYNCGDSTTLLNKLILACMLIRKDFGANFIDYIYGMTNLYKPTELIKMLIQPL
jgi:hypothetical protein